MLRTTEKFVPFEAERIYKDLIKKEPFITQDILYMANTTGGMLVDLEHSIKSPVSIMRKVNKICQDKGCNLLEAMNNISDLIRYTIIIPPDVHSSYLNDFTTTLSKYDYDVIKIDDKFKKPQKHTHYKGLHIDAMSPYGVQIEIQMHTRNSYYAKNKMHVFYEISRDERSTKRQIIDAINTQISVFDLIIDNPSFAVSKGA